jgi:hypothetical protein
LGVEGIHCIHESSTVAASAQGHSRVNSATLGMGWTVKVNDVTMQKLPPPPPRLAQYRSLWALGEHWRRDPSAVTTVREAMLSHVIPYARPKTPIPPPSARPAIPTVGHEPPGSNTPDAPSWL